MAKLKTSLALIGKLPGGNHAKASKIDAFALSWRDAARGFEGVNSSLPLDKKSGSNCSSIIVVCDSASGTVNRSCEQCSRKATMDDSTASKQIKSWSADKFFPPCSIVL
jgi:hypothetical protein